MNKPFWWPKNPYVPGIDMHDAFEHASTKIWAAMQRNPVEKVKFLKQPECPECAQNKASGMNFCAFCGRQLWDREG